MRILIKIISYLNRFFIKSILFIFAVSCSDKLHHNKGKEYDEKNSNTKKKGFFQSEDCILFFTKFRDKLSDYNQNISFDYIDSFYKNCEILENVKEIYSGPMNNFALGEILPIYHRDCDLNAFKKNLVILLNKKLQSVKLVEINTFTNKDRLKLLQDRELATIYAVIDRDKTSSKNFIKNWENVEKDSIPAYINAWQYAVTTSDKPISYEYVLALRTKLSIDSEGNKYNYSAKKEVTSSFDINDFCRNGEFGIPNAYRFLADFIEFVLGYFEHTVQKNSNQKHSYDQHFLINSFWLYLFYNRPDVFNSMYNLIDEYKKLARSSIDKTGWYPTEVYYYESIYKEAINIMNQNNIHIKNKLFADVVKNNYRLDINLFLFETQTNDYNAKISGILRSNSNISKEQAILTFNQICTIYNESTQNPNFLTDNEKYEKVITFVKAMEMMHWHSDWNMRTWLIILNKEFVRLGLPITWLDNPNCIDWMSVHTIIDMCKQGTKSLDVFLSKRFVNPYNNNIGTFDYGTEGMEKEEVDSLLQAVSMAINK